MIDRFSEDIELTLDLCHFSRSKARLANKAVVSICDNIGFKIVNRERVAHNSHAAYNCYYIEYPIQHASAAIKPYVQVEMVFMHKAYPSELKRANSLIREWLIDHESKGIKEYELEPFPVIVQTLDRTFVDKVFAICDYYLRKEPFRNSRHIYDLSRIINKINFDDSLRPLILEVYRDRLPSSRCPSAKEGIVISKILNEIVDTHYFESDYNSVTKLLLTKNVDYDEAIKTLSLISNSGLFD